MTEFRLGIDLGGTKIEIRALDAGGVERDRRRVPTPRGDYDATIRALVALVAATETEIGGKGSLGICIPGTISPATGLIKNANSVWLNGKPFHRDVSAAIGREVRFANDADCFALSEAIDGAGRDAPSVFGIIVGTGCGGGIVVNRRIVSGPNAIGGEWGHNPLPWPKGDESPGPQCYCGQRGCIETFISGTGFKRDFLAATGEEASGTEIAERARNGDPQAEAAMDRYVDRMARATATIINSLDPHVVILGGGMSKVSELYERVPARWPLHVFSDTVETVLRPPVHGDSSGVRGAAWLWPTAPEAGAGA